MNLGAMQFKNYTWPHNPRTYTIEYQRKMVAHKLPFGRYCLQNLGMEQRVMKGEGEFVGEGAYEDFRKLASVFYEETAGMLLHPLWQSAKAYFAELSLKQEPRENYVYYKFAFWEENDGYTQGLQKVASKAFMANGGGGMKYHTVVSGDSLWRIAKVYGLSLSALLALNPQIKNPNRIYPGEQVRVA